MSEWLPGDVQLDHIASIDQRLSGLDDRELIIALRQLGFDGLVTNNWRMLNIPMEIAAIVATRSVVVAMRDMGDMGDDAIRAAGALMLELPGLRSRIVPNRSNVFLLSYGRRRPQDAWDYLRRAAEHEGRPVQELWQASE
ncbi:MAG: hypothetical protein ACR2FG_09305 [Marmoricola sp.]